VAVEQATQALCFVSPFSNARADRDGLFTAQRLTVFHPGIDHRPDVAAALRCEETISVSARITEYENRLRIDYEVRNAAGQIT
jgi:acyl-CoA thioesterase FadM